MDEVDDADLVVERVAALDLGKAGLEACVRVPHPQRPGRRMQELRGYATTTAQLLAMPAWLRHWQVPRRGLRGGQRDSEGGLDFLREGARLSPPLICGFIDTMRARNFRVESCQLLGTIVHEHSDGQAEPAAVYVAPSASVSG